MWILPAVREPYSRGASAEVPKALLGPVEWISRRVLRIIGAHAQRSARRAATIASPRRSHFDRIVGAFFVGYRTALDSRSVQNVVGELSRIDAEYQGFAFEGAGMAVTALDLVWPSRTGRFAQLAAAAPGQIYLLHVGAGWALARFHCVEGRMFQRLDPVLRWLAVDGAGFHEGYFGAPPGRLRRLLSSAGARVFDQGLGRSLWFTADADPQQITSAIAGFERSRHADLWSGIGIACAYAGGVGDKAIEALRDASGPSRLHLAQGAAFAAEAHIRASGRAPGHTEQACCLICGLTAAQAAATARHAAMALSDEGDLGAYEVWRKRVRSQLGGLFPDASQQDSGRRPHKAAAAGCAASAQPHTWHGPVR